MFFNVKNLPLAPQYRKRLLQISANSVRNIHNHAKVEKTSATCNNKRWFVGNLHVLRWDGWLIAGKMHEIFVMQNKLILHGYIHFKNVLLFLNLFTHFPNSTKNFCSFPRIFQIITCPTSHPKDRVVNVCKHKFAYTNMTPKRRNGVHFITHAPYKNKLVCIKLSRLVMPSRKFKDDFSVIWPQ